MPRFVLRVLVVIGVFGATLSCGPRARGGAGGAAADPPQLAAISEADLRRDLFALAGPAMRGREAGTVDEMRASMWLAERAREAGLAPGGDDGTYFQLWPMRRTHLAPGGRLELGGGALRMMEDVVVVTPTTARGDWPVLYAGEGREADVAGVDLAGKAVAVTLSAPEGMPPLGRELSARRYATLAVRQRAAFLTQRGAAAVILVSDSVADGQFDNIGAGWARGSYAIDRPFRDDGGQTPPPPPTPVLWLRRRSLDLVRRPGVRLVADLRTQSFVVQGVNVVARAPGADPALRGQYVLYSAHQDGLGVRYAWEGDSVWSGADDNATTSVALLAIGRALVRAPARRSALFVWHGAEEVGLLGSTYHATHLTVPRDSIVAVLNGDMIGRGAPDTAALLGSQPPNRNAPALVAMALGANARVAHFAIDSSWDRPTHPEGFFRRSDHWPYARDAGLPVVYFSTLLHPDYHTPRDDPDRIDYPKLARMARWMYATGWAAGNAEGRVVVER